MFISGLKAAGPRLSEIYIWQVSKHIYMYMYRSSYVIRDFSPHGRLPMIIFRMFVEKLLHKSLKNAVHAMGACIAAIRNCILALGGAWLE
jgi:hypothetical protein